MLQWMKDQSRRRRLLLSEQLGVQQGEHLSRVLGTEKERNEVHTPATSRIPSETNLKDIPSLGYSSSHHRLVAQTAQQEGSQNQQKPQQSKLNQQKQPNQRQKQSKSQASRQQKRQKQQQNQNQQTGASKVANAPSSQRKSGKNKKSRRRSRRRRRHNCETESTAKGSKQSQPKTATLATAQLVVSSNQTNNDEEEDPKYEYKGSSTFLKGTQSANPHNDYCQHYVDTGQRPQNFIRDYELHDRFEEYPKLKELIKLKDDLIAQTATPPMYLKCDLNQPGQLKQLDSKFDVILVDPPLEEYQRTQGVTKTKFCSWDDVLRLEIEEIAAPRSFIFLWCGSSDGLDLGRKCLRKWGFRRCEDICWIKTNKKNIGHNKNLEPRAIFQRTKEHCLMGIKGTVRRSTDGDFIHSNVDIDLIISEEPSYGTYDKPDEIFHITEHFCLGRRRLHLFGKDSTIRPGWLTVGPELTNSNFNADLYKDYFSQSSTAHLTGCTDRIEVLRPKSPPPKGSIISIPPPPNVMLPYGKRF